MVKRIRLALITSSTLLLLAQGFAFAAGGTITGVVVAEREDRGGDSNLLLAVPAGIDGVPVDEIQIRIPKKIAKKLHIEQLPSGWTSDLGNRGLIFRGPPVTSGGPLAIALGNGTGAPLPEMGVSLLGNGNPLYSESGTAQQLARLATLDSADGLVQLPQAISPGEEITFKPYDPATTPPGGTWTIDDKEAYWNGSFTDSEYSWDVSLDYKYKYGLDLGLKIRYTDPWGETVVDGTWDDTDVVEGGNGGSGSALTPRIDDCSPKVLTNGIVCVCGNFPTSPSRTSLTLNGKALGAPLSASNSVLNFVLPEGTAPGEFTVSGTAAGGFDGSAAASGIHIAVGGEIDRDRLRRGDSTPLRLWLEGTGEATDLRLWNSTPSIVSLDGGEDQIVTTSGGSPNEVQRTVYAVSPGDFVLSYELTLGSCPCVEQMAVEPPTMEVVDTTPTTVETAVTTTAATTAVTTSTRTTTDCDKRKKECEELKAKADAARNLAWRLRQEANRVAREGRLESDVNYLNDLSENDRKYLETLRRQAKEWRKLAASARANAKINRERHRKYPKSGWDYWAGRDEADARRRDANAERLEQEADKLEGRIRGQDDRAKELRDQLRQAEEAAAKAEAEAARAQQAYEACLALFVLECPQQTGGTVVAGGSGTSVTPDGGDDPRDTPPPTAYGEEDDDDEDICPQRDGKHKQCVALLFDIAKHDNWRPGSLTDSKEYLEEMGCDVDYVAPRFHSVPPESYLVETSIWSWSKLEFVKTRYWVNTSFKREAAQSHNRRQMARVRAAIDSHRAKLRAGAVMGIEINYAHGSSNKYTKCGHIGPSFDWANNSISRQAYHKGNYDAAKGNVCIWHVVDFSCNSYLSARAIDNLNNMGTTECSDDQGFNRTFHAGYEMDVAHTCGHRGMIEVCTNADIAYLEDDINDVWESEISRQDDDGYDDSNAFDDMLSDLGDAAKSSIFSFSTYTDKGYELCNPPSHDRLGPY